MLESLTRILKIVPSAELSGILGVRPTHFGTSDPDQLRRSTWAKRILEDSNSFSARQLYFPSMKKYRTPAYRALKKLLPMLMVAAAATAKPGWLALVYMPMAFACLWLNEIDGERNQ